MWSGGNYFCLMVLQKPYGFEIVLQNILLPGKNSLIVISDEFDLYKLHFEM